MCKILVRSKRLLMLLSFVILAQMLSMTNISAYAADKAVVTVGMEEALPDTDVTIPIYLTGGKAAGGVELWLDYNTDKLSYVSSKTYIEAQQANYIGTGGGLKATFILDKDIQTNEKLKIAELIFHVKANSGKYPVSIKQANLINGSNYNNIEYSAENGFVSIVSRKTGDVSGDGKINIVDAMKIFNYVSGKDTSFTAEQMSVGDIDKNSKINIVDAMKVFHYVSGRISTLVSDTVSQPVNPTIAVTGVTLSKTKLNLTTGASAVLTATVAPANATNKNVTWSSSNTNVATVDGSGKVTAKAAGTANITVKTASGGKTAVSAVTVTNPTVEVTGVTLSKTKLNLTTGASAVLTATVAPANATNKNVTWSSSNTNVATVDGSGKVTAKAAGSATITVKTASGSKTAVSAVTVTNPAVAVKGVSIAQTDKIYLGADSSEKTKLTYNISPSNATNKNVTWSSSNTGIATVDGSGNVTAVNPGVATITVKTNDGGFTAKKDIYVWKNYVTPPSGTYIIKSKANPNVCFDADASDGTIKSGRNVGLYNINKGKNQIWRFDDYRSKHGGYAIVVCTGNLVVDVYKPTNGNMNIDWGDNIDIYDFNDMPAQMWHFAKLWDGSWRIILNSDTSGHSVITSTASNSGANIMLHGWNWNNPYQEWIFEKVDMPSGGGSSGGDSRIEKTISWANSQLGSQAYNYWCLKFVGDAFRQGGIQNAGYMTATQAGNKLITNSDKNPPRGAVVFWNWYGTIDGVYDNYGHVGISLGNGQVIHADYNGVKITGLDLGGSRTYRGWGTWK